MINREVKKQDVLKALAIIDKDGFPPSRRSTKYNLYYNKKLYPPKYVLSIATKIATGKELEPFQFNGGKETNEFLKSLGFTIHKESEALGNSSQNAVKICTALIQIPGNNWNNISNLKKFKLLSNILNNIPKNTNILVLPAGFLNTKNKSPHKNINRIESEIIALIKKYNNKIFICFGVDGGNEQIALTINNSGIVSIARKFHHMDNSLNLAESPFVLEQNMPRWFRIKNKRAYLAVCYDIYGISQLNLKNENKCDFIIGLIHGFDNSGGDVDFARKGLAGASKQWKVHSFGTAVFSENRKTDNWPSGVKWTHGNTSVKNLNYDKIRINSELSMITDDIATIYLRYFTEE